MDFIKKNIVGVVALIIALIGVFTPIGTAVVNGLGSNGTSFTTVGVTGLQVGANCADSNSSTCTGTAMTQVLKGTCTLLANASIAATSTGYASCAVSNVAAGDTVFVTLATSTTAIGTNYTAIGAQASTTAAGFIDVKLLNLTGTAAVPAATLNFGSSTQYLIIR